MYFSSQAIDNNTITNAGGGSCITLGSPVGLIVKRNTIKGCLDSAIVFSDLFNVTIENNILLSSNFGIYGKHATSLVIRCVLPSCILSLSF